MSETWRQTTRLAIALLFVGGAAMAQARGLREVRTGSTGGLGLMIGVPVGQFSDFVGVHPGLGGAFTFGGPVGLRVSGSLLVYGHQRELIPVAGGRILMELATDNIIGSMGVGPQITLGDGPVRLYGYGTIGFSYFATVSSLGDGCGCDSFETTNHDDFALAREAGGGLQVQLSRRPVLLDLSARYMRNGRVRYLREGGIVDNLDGTVSLRVTESEANLVVFQVGLSVGLR